MEPRRDRIQDRILPAVLTALGVTFLAAGLLTWTVPVEAGPPPSAPDNGAAATEAPGTSTPAPRITLPPLGTTPPSSQDPGPLVVEPDEDRQATRVRIAALDIDLPVIPPQGADDYPLCDVAMFIRQLSQPGNGGATYLYAHARPGMFEPLLVTRASRQLGMIVEVWTNDDLKFLYEIIEVRRRQTTLDAPAKVKRDELWLQTSEGPRGTVGKTQVRARFLSVERASHAQANPTPHPVDCE